MKKENGLKRVYRFLGIGSFTSKNFIKLMKTAKKLDKTGLSNNKHL